MKARKSTCSLRTLRGDHPREHDIDYLQFTAVLPVKGLR
jgi:hypothetical protein